jgi:hypothetical protein
MKIELNDEELKLLLETLGKNHIIAFWKKDKKEQKDLGNLITIVISEAEKQGKKGIVDQVFQQCEPPK